jgi:peptidoglycan/xylan/chitin deacetylase (PgdA/CDA1 family)
MNFLKDNLWKVVPVLVLAIVMGFSFFVRDYLGILRKSETRVSLTVQSEKGKIIFSVKNAGEKIAAAQFFRDGRPFYRYFAPVVASPSGVVTIMFDDGWLDIYEEAYPLLAKAGYQASIAVVADYVDRPGAVSSKQLQKLIESGWELTSHGLSDNPLTPLSKDERRRQFSLSKRFLWQNLWATEAFVFPSGDLNPPLIEMAKRYYRVARGYEQGINPIPIDPFNIKTFSLEQTTTFSEVAAAIDKAEDLPGWLVLVGHHVTNSDLGRFTISPELFSQILAYLKTKRIRVIPFEQAAQELSRPLTEIGPETIEWEFSRSNLKTGHYEFFVMIGDQRSDPVRIKI